MAQSYSNSGGSGQRRYLILIKTTSVWGPGATSSPIHLIDGSLANAIWFDTQVSGQYSIFDFGQPRIIDEAKWYQDNSTSQGTWKFQGSNDDSTYTDIGSTFTLGGATTQTITTINGNTTPYRYYKLLQTAGSTSSSPYTKGIEFQIDDLDTSITQYGNTYGVGDRTASITISQSTTAGVADILVGPGNNNPALSPLVDNLNSAATPGKLGYDSLHLAMTGKWLKFQFPDYRIIDEFRWWYSTDNTQSTWKLQGSNDNSTWADLGTSQLINGSWIAAKIYDNGASICCFVFNGCNGNTSSYLYYRMLGVSGTTSNDSNLIVYEIGFRIKAGAAPPTGGKANPILGVSPIQGYIA